MRVKIFLFLIVLLGFFLRFYKVGEIPNAIYGDEQAFAWNAYNILKLGQDEYGTPYPLQFRSFDDYKSPVPAYLLVPFIKYLGLNAFAIRLPIVLASTLTLFAVFLLVHLFFNNKVSLLISFLMAISPWHIHLARAFFESELCLLFIIFGTYFFLRSNSRLKEMLISSLFFSLSLYSYLTPRIFLPIFIPFLFIHSFISYGKKSISQKRILFNAVIGFIFLIILSIPLLKFAIFDKGLSRFNKLASTVNNNIIDIVNRERSASNLAVNIRPLFHNKYFIWFRFIKDNYLEHLSPNFLYIFGDNNLRLFTGNMGMFYLIEFPLLLIGIYQLWIKKREAAIFFLGWLLISPIPSSVVGRPFGVRSLVMLPVPFVFTGYGLYSILNNLNKQKNLIGGVISILYIFAIGSLLIRYYFEYPVYAATWWGWENKTALEYAKLNENKYDRIFVSNFYSGITLAYAVYYKIDPLEYRKAISNPIILADGRSFIKLGKYYFGSLDLNNDRLQKKIIPEKSLYIGRPEEPGGEDEILSPGDKRVIFVIHDTLKKRCYLEKRSFCNY